MCLLSIHPVSHIFRSCGFLFALIGLFYHPVTMQTTVTIISIAHSFSAAIWGITCRVEDHCSLTVLMIVVIMRDVSPQIRFPFHKPFTIVYSFCIIILILCLFVCFCVAYFYVFSTFNFTSIDKTDDECAREWREIVEENVAETRNKWVNE